MTERRRILRLLGLGAAALLLPRTSSTGPTVSRWQGVALGAPARIELHGIDLDRARRAIEASLEELARLEAVFSLFDPESALSRLNRDGVLRAPPLELVEVLGFARTLAILSEGAFDPTIQPLWRAVAHGATRQERVAARRRVDWRKLEVSPGAVALLRRGMAVTLDGIAQGYLTDRIAGLLRAHGVERVLVDLGELRALGPHPEGRPWRIGRHGLPAVELADGALATSAVVVDGRPRILDPRTGEPPADRAPVTVLAPEALSADGLSTALAVVGRGEAAGLLRAFPGARMLAAA
ncbi:MAG: FAD:protein FMN transferase [Geminicoccaceae bacterium]|jgi:thiamine biosynthesis lipoprotein|nr:MAG: FAD:protein FMN transferase [Geminicoccaceae bacterium]